MAKKTGHSYKQLATAFRHKNFEPLYFLYGEETFLIDELQDLLIQNAVAPEQRDFNFDLVYGSESEGPAVLSLCSSFPMMADRRLVVVREFDKLDENRVFTDYASDPNPSAIVFLACTRKPNLSRHPYRALKKHAVWSEFKSLYDNKLPGWISNRVEALGYDIEPQAAQHLAEYIGSDLQTAATEIDKVITYAGGRTRLTADDVVHASGQMRAFNVFELQKAIGKGEYADTMRIAENMLRHASNPTGEALRMVIMLDRYFQKLWKLLTCRSLGKYEIAKRIGVSSYFVREYTSSLRTFDRSAIENAFSALLAADYELKGGAEGEPSLVITLLLRRIFEPLRGSSEGNIPIEASFYTHHGN